MASFPQGTIVWATMLDPRGSNRKCRPGIVLNCGHQSGEDLVIAAITTAFDMPLPPGIVELPCDGMTLLKRRSAVVCNWLVVLTEGDVISRGGQVSPRLMLKILNKLPRGANL